MSTTLYPSADWMKLYNEKKNVLTSPNDFNLYFNSKELFHKPLYQIEMGELSFPKGEIIVRDPLVYLQRNEKPYFITIPRGEYPLTILVIELEKDHNRYVGFRVKIKKTIALTYTEALLGNEDLENLQEGEYFGFNVDAGLATIVDSETKEAFCDFTEKWSNDNPDKNIYDDYLAEEFRKNYEKNPLYQREGGDWINFKIPGTGLSVPMIQSGFGDGTYPVYFGFDEKNEVCEIIVQFIDIELALENEEEED